MYELLFVIFLNDGSITKELWPDDWTSIEQCEANGWIRYGNLHNQIRERYPKMQAFDIECRPKDIEV